MATELPVRKDLTCYKGQSYYQNLRFRVGPEKAVYPLTGYTAKAHIRPAENSEKLDAEMICSVTGVDGLISLALTEEQTAALRAGVHYWDLRTVTGTGRVKYWIKGKFIVQGRVTV